MSRFWIKEQGFTLIEVLGTVLIIGLIAGPMLGLLSQGMWTVHESGNHTKAVNIAQGQMERLKALDFDEINMEDDNLINEDHTDEHFTVNTQVTDVTEQFQASSSGRLLLLEVTVKWDEKGRDREYQLSTYQASR